MISDTLHESADEIRRYLHDPVMGLAYIEPTLLHRIQDLLTEMDAIRAQLDAVPDGPRLEHRGDAIIRDEHGREVKRIPYSTLAANGRRIWSNTGEDVSLRNGWSIQFPTVKMTIS